MKKKCITAALLAFTMFSSMNLHVWAEETADSEVKILTTATANEVNTLYPLNMDPQNNVVDRMVYQGLVTYENGEIQPLLAESWEYEDNGSTLVFHLKEDVKFHDGTAFNAEAVKTYFDFIKDNPNFGDISAVANLDNVQVIDELTVAFHYTHPYFAYLNDFCYTDVMIIVSPEVIEEGNTATLKGVIGTGPYVYEEYVAGEYTRFVKNENYWGEEPYYDEVVVKFIPDSASRLQALQTGEIDMLFGSALVTYDDFMQATSMAEIEGIVSETNSETRNIIVNASSEKLSDSNVRNAIAYAIDKQGISDGITYGYETPADILCSKNTEYCDITLETVREFNQEKANELLDAAGWVMNEKTGIREKDGQALSIVLTFDSGEFINEPLALVIKDQLKQVGIDVSTSPLDQYSWWMGGVAGEYDLTIWDTTRPYTDPQNFFISIAYGSSPHVAALPNLEGSEEMIGLIQEFMQSDDIARVAEIFDDLINYSNNNVLDIPLTYAKEVMVYNSNVISGYDFGSVPMVFDITRVVPAE